jgi:hypothetical protein
MEVSRLYAHRLAEKRCAHCKKLIPPDDGGHKYCLFCRTDPATLQERERAKRKPQVKPPSIKCARCRNRNVATAGAVCVYCERVQVNRARVQRHCRLCEKLFHPAPRQWNAELVFCVTCRSERRKEVDHIRNRHHSERKPKSAALGAYAPTTDTTIMRLLREIRRYGGKIVYDRDAGVGSVPENLKRYLDDPNTYKIAHLRGRPAIVRAA